MTETKLVILQYVPETRKTSGVHLAKIKSHVAKLSQLKRAQSRPSLRYRGPHGKAQFQHIDHVSQPGTKSKPESKPKATPSREAHTPDQLESLNRAVLMALLQNPLSIVGHGASDPFASQSIPITAETNGAISFVRDVVIPTIYMPPYAQRFCRRSINLNLMRSDLIMGSRFANRDIAMHMSDPDLLPAWLCSHMLYSMIHLPPGFRKDMNRVTLQIRTAKMQHLRDKISKSAQIQD